LSALLVSSAWNALRQAVPSDSSSVRPVYSHLQSINSHYPFSTARSTYHRSENHSAIPAGVLVQIICGILSQISWKRCSFFAFISLISSVMSVMFQAVTLPARNSPVVSSLMAAKSKICLRPVLSLIPTFRLVNGFSVLINSYIRYSHTEVPGQLVLKHRSSGPTCIETPKLRANLC
jgi:hypothetical protein